jgi:hypothetical protein
MVRLNIRNLVNAAVSTPTNHDAYWLSKRTLCKSQIIASHLSYWLKPAVFHVQDGAEKLRTFTNTGSIAALNTLSNLK